MVIRDSFVGLGTLAQLIVQPYRAFIKVVERPSLMFPYGIAMLMGVGAFILFLPRTLQIVEGQMQSLPGAKVIAVVTGVLVALLTPWLAGLVSAIILAFACVTAGGTSEFKVHLSVVGFARLPLLLQGLILAVMGMRVPTFDGMRNLSLSLAVFWPNDAYLVRALVSAVGPFEIWHFILLTIGFGALIRTKPSRVWWFGAMMAGLKVLVTAGTMALS